MKHFFLGERELPFVKWRSGLLTNQNINIRVQFFKVGSAMLLVLFCLQAVSLAQESRGRGAAMAKKSFQIPAGPAYNYSLYDAVWSEPIVSEKYYLDAIKRYPKADFNKYPMASYYVDTMKVPSVREGDLLPDEVLDLPLWVVNDQHGRDTITLRTEMDKEWVILDFWFESCSPCIYAMKRWESLMETEGYYFNLLGVFTSLYPHRAAYESRRFGWRSTQVIGESMKLLRTVFMKTDNVAGLSIWIKDGRVFGASDSKLSEEEHKAILRGELQEIPEYARWVVRAN